MPKAATPSKQAFVEQIPVKLTPEEMIMKGRELARLGTQVVAKKAEQKSAVASIKSEIDSLEEEQANLIQQLNTGEEERPVECFERPRYQDLIVDIIRADLGTVWRQRPMHPSERQLAINTGDVEITTPAGGTAKGVKKKKPAPEEPTETAH